ncbi:hypothetical protein PTSG_09511 [Salpingoeca rosetta]|uniref:Uncharacterized protein n=1 Tax=Salpingoeca rosetta (strain ATCC 50818 / BSB-021) TaxID=946362 RepID=F2UL78_SALR5|nr:uncharacterized protein PTSG_09511 [Salpingoeca rosetta]EGD77877.1 hypothetical protein PTSG_09511 [Salpingoeca rosetta]|eukprot:XP_004989941.1 hypothetical protein PTSG_09511 [Salpingoeca rosetta]
MNLLPRPTPPTNALQTNKEEEETTIVNRQPSSLPACLFIIRALIQRGTSQQLQNSSISAAAAAMGDHPSFGDLNDASDFFNDMASDPNANFDLFLSQHTTAAPGVSSSSQQHMAPHTSAANPHGGTGPASVASAHSHSQSNSTAQSHNASTMYSPATDPSAAQHDQDTPSSFAHQVNGNGHGNGYNNSSTNGSTNGSTSRGANAHARTSAAPAPRPPPLNLHATTASSSAAAPPAMPSAFDMGNPSLWTPSPSTAAMTSTAAPASAFGLNLTPFPPGLTPALQISPGVPASTMAPASTAGVVGRVQPPRANGAQPSSSSSAALSNLLAAANSTGQPLLQPMQRQPPPQQQQQMMMMQSQMHPQQQHSQSQHLHHLPQHQQQQQRRGHGAARTAAESDNDFTAGPPRKRAPPSMHPSSQAPAALREHVSRYLTDVSHMPRPGPNQVITILHSRVVQKSYGNEKRFFCPPPAVQLSGQRWHNSPFGDVRMFVSMGSVHTNGPHHAVELDQNFYGCAKSLYISDTDKRKSFCLHFKVFHSKDEERGRDVGTFTSKPIKVISKPPKKKNNAARSQSDLCVETGSEIALFNRVRSQSGKTRYLVGDREEGFKIDTSFWSTFTVDVVPGDDSQQARQSAATFVNYGSTVTLTCSNTNQKLGPFLVRRVENRKLTDADNDPVSQLQKVAFQATEGARGFVTMVEDGKVGYRSPKALASGAQQLTDASLWTVTSCDRVTFSFCEPPRPDVTAAPVNPVPIVSTVKSLNEMVELYGENFSTHLTVWFGTVPAETFYRCEELVLCHRPSFDKIRPDAPDGICRTPTTVPLLLVRSDGVIYDTGKHYTYEIDHVAIIRVMARQRSSSKISLSSNEH